MAAFKSRAPIVLVAGPAGTGKSRAILEKLHYMCLRNPGLKCLIVRQVAASLAASALATYENHVADLALKNKTVIPFGGSVRKPPGYVYSNGSTISYGGLDKPTKIMSTEYDVIYVCEATELNVTGWESLDSRLRNGKISFQQLIADCNPDAPTHFLKVAADEGRILMLHSRHQDNPRYFDERGLPTKEGMAYMERLSNLTGVRRARLKDGLWVGAEGVIYDEFDDAVHVIDSLAIPDSWSRYWSIDWGTTNPFVCQMWAEDPDGRLYLYREFYRTGRTVDQHVEDILAVVTEPIPGYVHPPNTERFHFHGRRWIEPRPTTVIADHDAGDRAIFTRWSGIPTTPAKKDVSVGIQTTQQRYRKAADSRPRIFFVKNAVVYRDPSLALQGKPCSTLEEEVRYVWDVVEGKVSKDQPKKENDHGQDAKRYIVMHRDHAQYNIRFFD